jgi:hypothetical protein
VVPETGLEIDDGPDDLPEALLLFKQTLSSENIAPEVRGLKKGVEFQDAPGVGRETKATPR